jgi:hypothetical protein
MFAPLLCALSLLAAQGQQGDPAKTEVWTPVPPVVTPGPVPSDAISLAKLDAWRTADGAPANWDEKDGVLTVKSGTGDILSAQKFGSCQLHVEWRTPTPPEGEGQGRGNSGIFLMGAYEVQVLDSYENKTYSNGQAGSIYKQHIPLVNASLPPGEWQTYDIFFTAPVFNDDKSLKSPGFVTVVHNGLLILNHVEIKGETVYIGEPKYTYHEAKESIRLQNHGNPVSYRNIWVREL